VNTSDEANSMAQLLDCYAARFDEMVVQNDADACSKLDVSFAELWAEQRAAWPDLWHPIIALGLASCDVINVLDIVTTSRRDIERYEAPYLRGLLNAHDGALSALREQVCCVAE
jgi:hypothetical protein